MIGSYAKNQFPPTIGHDLLAFLDPLLGSAALIVERNNPLGRTAQVGDDEADAGIQFP